MQCTDTAQELMKLDISHDGHFLNFRCVSDFENRLDTVCRLAARGPLLVGVGGVSAILV